MTSGVVLEHVSKTFAHRPSLFNLFGKERRGSTRALKDVSLTAEPGEVMVLAGPNGSGKTTLLKLISTMLLPDSGSVTVAGMETRSRGDDARRLLRFAVANERSFFPHLTATENLELFGTQGDLPRPEHRTREALPIATAPEPA